MKFDDISEGVAGPQKCWPGHRKIGTQPGTGKNAGKRVNKCKKIGEGLGDEVNPADVGEYDREGEMAMGQLKTAEDAAAELRSILDADENLPEWVQSKITKAVDYLDTVRDYMKSKEQGVAEGSLEEIDRRGFLKGLGAAAAAGGAAYGLNAAGDQRAAGRASAQSKLQTVNVNGKKFYLYNSVEQFYSAPAGYMFYTKITQNDPPIKITADDGKQYLLKIVDSGGKGYLNVILLPLQGVAEGADSLEPFDRGVINHMQDNSWLSAERAYFRMIGLQKKRDTRQSEYEKMIQRYIDLYDKYKGQSNMAEGSLNEAEEKSTKAEAKYQDMPKNGQRCDHCTMWRPPHGCSAVKGVIAKDGWCSYYKRSKKDVVEANYYNPMDQDRREQDAMDASKKSFKRQELDFEYQRERELAQQRKQAEQGPWYLRIDGKVYRQKGQPKVFAHKKAANGYALAIIKNRPELQGKIMLTKSDQDR